MPTSFCASARSSSAVPSFRMTYCERLAFSSTGICAASRASASASVIPRVVIIRSICFSREETTQHIISKFFSQCASNKSGITAILIPFFSTQRRVTAPLLGHPLCGRPAVGGYPCGWSQPIGTRPSRAKRVPRGAEAALLGSWGCAPDPESDSASLRLCVSALKLSCDRDSQASIFSLTSGWSFASRARRFSGSANTSAAMRRRSSGSGIIS